MITAAEILSASLVLNNGLGFDLSVSSFIANTSDGFLGARGNTGATSHDFLARLAKRWISSRDIDDATFLPKMTESDQWLYAIPPCLPALSRRMRNRGESPEGGEYPPIKGAIVGEGAL
jgi:hypothetical protein